MKKYFRNSIFARIPIIFDSFSMRGFDRAFESIFGQTQPKGNKSDITSNALIDPLSYRKEIKVAANIKIPELRAIREFCLECFMFWYKGGIEKCWLDNCALYPFRTGKGKPNIKRVKRAIRAHCNCRKLSWCIERDSWGEGCPLYVTFCSL